MLKASHQEAARRSPIFWWKSTRDSPQKVNRCTAIDQVRRGIDHSHNLSINLKNFRNSWQVLWNFSALVLLQCPHPSPPCAVSSCRLTKFRPSPETSQVPGPTQFKEKPRPWELKVSADLWPSGWGGCGDGIHMAMIPVNICIWNQLVLITIIFDQTICKQVSV